MGTEEKIDRIKDMLDKFRKKHPTIKSYPLEFWREVYSLSKHHSASEISTYLGIGHNNLLKRLARMSGKSASERPKFIQIPKIETNPEQCRIRIEYPTGVKIQIF